MDSIFPSTVIPRLARALGALAAFFLGFAAFAASEPSAITGQKKSFAYSWQEELQLGAEADKEIVEEMGLYENPALQAYVETLGQKLVQVSAFTGPNSPEIYRNTKFIFRIINSPVVNAFALPGGYVYVTRGLLAHVENEAQLAVVLGHEIAHVAARHSSQQARRNQWGQIGVLLGSVLGQKVLGEKMPDIGSNILNAGGKATEMFLLRYSREAENESDSLGVTYATRAGYAAAESSRFFQALQRISATEGKSLPTWQSTHPDPGDRARRVIQLAASSPLPNGAQPVVGQDEFLRQVDGLVVGDNPREGFAQNGVFYHPTLRFQLPVAPGWQVDNQKSAVIFGQPNGSARMGLRLVEGSRARDAAYQFIQKTGVQVVANGDTTVNGLPTTVIIGKKDTESGPVEAWNAFIEMDNRVFSLLGLTSQQTFEQFRSTFESTAAGFAPLRDNQAATVQPTMLKVVRADRTGPFASFVPTSLPQDLNAEEIAIMNQVAMNESIPAGRLLKVPEVQAAPAPERVDNRRNRGDRDRNRNYPQTSRYPEPTAQTPYPDASRYPQSTYPQPQSSYPDYTQTNRGSTPQSNTSYPPPSYPAQNYPQQTYPQQNYPQPAYPTYSPSGYPQMSSPQFPQPQGSPSTQRPTQNPQPTWPR